MSILSWVFVGLFAGLLARFIVRDDRSGCLYTIAVGVLGALIGGALMQWAGHQGVNEFDIRSILVAALGAILLLLILGAIRGDGARRQPREQLAHAVLRAADDRPVALDDDRALQQLLVGEEQRDHLILGRPRRRR